MDAYLVLVCVAFGVRPGSDFNPISKPYHNEMPFHYPDFYQTKKVY